MAGFTQRTAFAAIADIRNSQDMLKSYPYSGSYSEPYIDRQGFVRFGWTAEVDDIDIQPLPRISIIHPPETALDQKFVETYIHRAILEHLVNLAIGVSHPIP